MEETRGVFDICEVWQGLQKTEKLEVYTNNTFRYIIEVDYIDTTTIKKEKYLRAKEGATEKKYYCWVDLNELLTAIDSTKSENKQSIKLSSFKNSNLHTDIYNDLKDQSDSRIKLDKIRQN